MTADARAQMEQLMQAGRAELTEMRQPTATPQPGQTVEEWLSEVAEARAMADGHALKSRATREQRCRDLFGVVTNDFLEPISGELTRQTLFVPVPADAQLDPKYGAPQGPGVRIPVDGETYPLRVTLTTPPNPTSAIIRLHGGAFWMGGGEVCDVIDDEFVDRMALTANAAVYNVDYRLSPEFPFPAAIVDTLYVLEAVRAGLGGVTVPAEAIGLIGISSGSNIATAAAKAEAMRDDVPPIAAMALLVPSVLIADVPEWIQANPAIQEIRTRQIEGYLGTEVSPADPWVSLADVPALTGFPPTFAAIAAYDEIAAGGQKLVEAIQAGGGDATAKEYPMSHTVASPETEASFVKDIVGFLAKHLLP